MARTMSAGIGAVVGLFGVLSVLSTVAPVVHNIATVLGGVR